MQKVLIRRRSSAADAIVLALVLAGIYALVAYGREWEASFHRAVDIDLSLYSLPYYTLFSALRGMGAFVLSLSFTLVVGYWAAKSAKAEKILIPLLDILQSIPVLGFLPGLVLVLIALFPRTNTGLELACIIMIFTGQVWNMTFSFYSSLKAVPADFNEVSSIIGLTPLEKLQKVEMPFAAMNLVWNSLMSMSGGWFFLSVCEAFNLADKSGQIREYRLPGIGAYMATAISQGNAAAMTAGIVAMSLLIIFMDILIWRPVLAWAHQFRLEDIPGFTATEPLMRNLVRESGLLRWVQLAYRRRALHQSLLRKHEPESDTGALRIDPHRFIKPGFHPGPALTWAGRVLIVAGSILIAYGTVHLVTMLLQVSTKMWGNVFLGAGLTLLRVFACLILGSIWTVPLGIWIGTSPHRIRIAQPIVQVLASFPAPMLYPLALAVMVVFRIPFGIGAMFLMLLGVQWYILFNVLAGAMRVPVELKYASLLMKIPNVEMWKKLYLPSVFPALVTGWVTAAGGAWNASIVAEYLSYKGSVLTTHGLGSVISIAASTANFPVLAASLTVMVGIVILLNRTLWARIYHVSQTRFRMDL
jgi:NitT/TauT family transport system permease protein